MNSHKPHSKKIFIILQLLASCSGLEKSEQDKIREQNAHGEYIYRQSAEVDYPVPEPKHRTREPHPWEKE